MTTILVPLGAPDDQCRALAARGEVAYLYDGEPDLTSALDAHAGEETLLVPVRAGRAPAGESWVARVAGAWRRAHPAGAALRVSRAIWPEDAVPGHGQGREVTGDEAPLTSSEWERVPAHGRHLLLCRGPRCMAAGAAQAWRALGSDLHALEREDEVLVTSTGCLYPCNHAPVAAVYPDGRWYGRWTAEDVHRLIGHVRDGEDISDHEVPRSRAGTDAGG